MLPHQTKPRKSFHLHSFSYILPLLLVAGWVDLRSATRRFQNFKPHPQKSREPQPPAVEQGGTREPPARMRPYWPYGFAGSFRQLRSDVRSLDASRAGKRRYRFHLGVSARFDHVVESLASDASFLTNRPNGAAVLPDVCDYIHARTLARDCFCVNPQNTCNIALDTAF